MKLLIDTRNGLAGDIMAAGLIGLGADIDAVTSAMEHAGNLMGRADISHVLSHGVHRMNVSLFELPGHLHAGRAREMLRETLEYAGIPEPWHSMGTGTLEALIEAEGHVHAHHPALKKHYHGEETVLHEASDIIVDIAGMAAGMRYLDIRELRYLGHVNVGSGIVTFSHGTLEVPAPATRRILDKYGFTWQACDSGMEMATPTGAAVLAGCNASKALAAPRECRKALAGGTRPLPPVAFYISE